MFQKGHGTERHFLQFHELAAAPRPARTHRQWFPWAPLLGPVWLSIFVDGLDDKLRTRPIQFSNSRRLGRVVSVLGDGVRSENGPD